MPGNKIPSPFAATPDAFWFWGRLGLSGAFVGGLLLILLTTVAAGEMLPYLVLGLVGAIAVWALYRRPVLNLCVTIAAFAVVTDFEEGIQIQEALYGVYYLGFLAHWFVSRVFLYRENILRTNVDRALAAFLVWVTATFALTFLFDGKLSAAVSEWASVVLLAFYFPIKEACSRYERGPQAILATMILLGVFVAARNLVFYKSILDSAEALWRITSGRVVTNEILLVIPGLAALALLAYARKWTTRGFYMLCSGLLLVGLILTQSRAYWIDYALGAAVLFFIMDRVQQLRLGAIVVSGAVLLISVLLVLFGDLVTLVLSGILDRLFTLGSAAAQDISLINRIYESEAVFGRIIRNPIIGYGLGVPYEVFDIISDRTMSKTFAHNGLLTIWYKYGLVGLGLLLYVWVRSIRNGLATVRRGSSVPSLRVFAMIAFAGLIAIFPSTNTSVQFFLSDTNLAFALLIGWANGLHARIDRGSLHEWE